MRPAAAALLAAALIACSSQAASQPSPAATPNAQSPAADLRVHLDLLLAEHVMIVAKESESAAYHSEEYAAYTTLLGANTADLSSVVGRALGPTTAAQFAHLWNVQNGYLVDYAIGLVTHDDDKANAAMTGIRNDFSSQFVQLFEGVSAGAQVNAYKTFIDDVAGLKYPSFYADLHVAYVQTQALGDSLTAQIVRRFPDRYPGQADSGDATRRVTMNLLLQERSYLATMATDAAVAKRDAEKAAAAAALAVTARQLDKAWADWDASLVAYATGATGAPLASADRLGDGAPRLAVQHLVDATIRVIDDQKAKNSKAVADDDRAAATATEPIADSI